MIVRDLARTVRDQWLVVVAAVVVVCAAAGAVWFQRPAEYSTRLTMYVSAQTADTAQTAYQGGLLAQQRVAGYVKLVNSLRVTGAVIATLGLRESPSKVADQITATYAADSVLFDIVVTDTDAERATAIANTTGAVLRELVEELERPVTSAAIPPVALRIVQPAQRPTAPSSLGLPLVLVLGAVAGLALGLAIAIARSKLDKSIKTTEQLSAAAQVSVLGTIPFGDEVRGKSIVLPDDSSSARSEAFRRLRTSLQFANVDRAHRVVIVTSSSPAEGKSTTLCNLAVATAAVGKRVLMIDGDLRRSKLASLVGLDGSVGLIDVLTGTVDLNKAVQQWEGGGLDVLTGGVQLPTSHKYRSPSELLASEQMNTLLKEVREAYDVVLIDTPPLSTVTDAAVLAAATDGAILVCRFKTDRGDVQGARETLNAASASLLGAVLTFAPTSGRRAYGRYGDLPVRGPADACAGHLPEPSQNLRVDETLPVNGRHVPEPPEVVGDDSPTNASPVPCARPTNGVKPLGVDTPDGGVGGTDTHARPTNGVKPLGVDTPAWRPSPSPRRPEPPSPAAPPADRDAGAPTPTSAPS